MYIYIYFIVYRNRALLYYIITKTRMRIYRKNEREQCQQCCQFKSSFSKILLEKKKKKWYDGF